MIFDKNCNPQPNTITGSHTSTSQNRVWWRTEDKRGQPCLSFKVWQICRHMSKPPDSNHAWFFTAIKGRNCYNQHTELFLEQTITCAWSSASTLHNHWGLQCSWVYSLSKLQGEFKGATRNYSNGRLAFCTSTSELTDRQETHVAV